MIKFLKELATEDVDFSDGLHVDVMGFEGCLL